MSKQNTVVAEPDEDVIVKTKPKNEEKRKRQPPYHVLLWNDDDHSYEYVILMLRAIFGHSVERGFKIAESVDNAGRAVCMTTTRELAELKRDQIHAYVKDDSIAHCKGSMSATIEPSE